MKYAKLLIRNSVWSHGMCTGCNWCITVWLLDDDHYFWGAVVGLCTIYWLAMSVRSIKEAS